MNPIYLFELERIPSFCPLRANSLIVPLNTLCPRHAKVKLCKLCKDNSVDMGVH